VHFHHAVENDNMQMAVVGDILRDIAIEMDCAVLIGHHSSKPERGRSRGFIADQHSARGGSALQGVTRIMVTLNTADKTNATKFNIDADEHYRYARLDNAKSNLSLSKGGSAPNWFKRESVVIGNGDAMGIMRPIEVETKSNVKQEETADRTAVALVEAMLAAGPPGGWYAFKPIREKAAAECNIADDTMQRHITALGTVTHGEWKLEMMAGRGRKGAAARVVRIADSGIKSDNPHKQGTELVEENS
jgi:hypothetical protein